MNSRKIIFVGFVALMLAYVGAQLGQRASGPTRADLSRPSISSSASAAATAPASAPIRYPDKVFMDSCAGKDEGQACTVRQHPYFQRLGASAAGKEVSLDGVCTHLPVFSVFACKLSNPPLPPVFARPVQPKPASTPASAKR